MQFKSSFFNNKAASEGCKETITRSYPKTNSWEEGTDCCLWDGVTCSNITGQVIGLDLSCSCLYGSISSNTSLFHLPHLQKLNLAHNDFNDSIMPSEFVRFTSLMYLNLTDSMLSGSIPPQINQLSKLVLLDLSWNGFDSLDEDTTEGLVRNLTELRSLSLDGIDMSLINPQVFMNLPSSFQSLSLIMCNLQGKFPENIFQLPNLKSLYLASNNELNLSLPEFNRSSRIELLDLRGTSLSGSFPDSIGNLQSLKYLYLSGTSFSGVLPSSIGDLVSLKQLRLADLSLFGGLPNSIGNLVSLEWLLLVGCNLTGTIPRSLGNLSQLVQLDLSMNHFTGEIPFTLTNLTRLKYLGIDRNQLEGPIPDEVNAFPNLKTLVLSSNFLNGTIPSWLYTISSIKSIHLEDNQLTGHIQQFHGKALEVIYLWNNRLQGPVPSSISQLVNLYWLDLSSNNLSGIVEFGLFSNLQKLQHLDVSYNHLSFNSTTSTADYVLPDLLHLYLASCNINEFPKLLRGSEKLIDLDLSNNRIHGEIPKWMWGVAKDSLRYLNLSANFLTEVEQLPWRNIEIIDLGSNLIQGNLLVLPPKTSIFFISNNSLSGEIPGLICNVSSIEILDLSRNNLGGIIPQCFGNLSKGISMLNLRMNKFHGTIPSTFTEGCQLKNLNLNGNQLEGPISRSILNCTGMEVLDLGNNKINDTFPHWLGSLPELQVLVLKSNQLHGSIQGNLHNHSFSKLQIFDLSSNDFTGYLPTEYITNFMAMMNLRGNESLRYMGYEHNSDQASVFYTYSIHLDVKGLEREFQKIFTMLTSIDLSNNQFQGEIPTVIGRLNSLIGLNLSHNNLSGSIPPSMGNLTSLEWLDLSWNNLVGKIPEQLVRLTSLSFLNLSENHLHGMIPQGKQFNTFENNSYEGNHGLCGMPLSKLCSYNQTQQVHKEDGSESSIGFGWEVVLVGYGFGLVFGMVVGYVVFKTGKPKWVVSLVEGQKQRRPKIARNGFRGRRRMN
ncbi:hypothetical protein PTKIN_Ptkin14bG0225800 [Pterospermum kingtungense]